MYGRDLVQHLGLLIKRRISIDNVYIRPDGSVHYKVPISMEQT